MLTLSNPLQPYAWGEHNGISRRLGTEPTDGPEAELWVGAHPLAPSCVDGGGRLDELIAAEPRRILGAEVAEAFGPRLPFLLKVLAIGSPLSIQLHPSRAQAEAGFAREEATGLARDDPRRSYRDPNAKPELLVALEPTWVLAGLRTGADAAEALRSADRAALGELADLVDGEPDARAGLVHLLTADEAERDRLARAAGGLDPLDGTGPPDRDWVRRLASAFPGDPSALAPFLLQVRHLETGQGVFVPAGVPHAYLRGAAVELMGSSDNVVRGGLTPKPIDVNELVTLLAPPGDGVASLDGDPDDGSGLVYRPDVPEIALVRVQPGGTPAAAPDGPGPALALATGGEVVVEAGDDSVALGAGRAVLVLPAERSSCRLRGPGTIWWATVGAFGPGPT